MTPMSGPTKKLEEFKKYRTNWEWEDFDTLMSKADAAIAELEEENERLKAGYIRIVQCHAYMMTITAENVETGVVGPHFVDGNDRSDIMTIVHEVFPDFPQWAEKETS